MIMKNMFLHKTDNFEVFNFHLDTYVLSVVIKITSFLRTHWVDPIELVLSFNDHCFDQQDVGQVIELPRLRETLPIGNMYLYTLV